MAIYRGITTNNGAMTLAGSLLIALLALAMDFILGFVEQRMKVRDRKARKANRILLILVLVIAAALTAGAFWGQKKKDTVHIATKPMTEQYVLGEMLSILIEQETGLNTELTQGVGGGTSNIQPAMEKGEFDIYPEYTGTGWNMVLKKSGIYTEDMFGQLKAGYEEKCGMQWLGMYGFNNTYGLAVRRETAEKYNRTYSGLKEGGESADFWSGV